MKSTVKSHSRSVKGKKNTVVKQHSRIKKTLSHEEILKESAKKGVYILGSRNPNGYGVGKSANGGSKQYVRVKDRIKK